MLVLRSTSTILPNSSAEDSYLTEATLPSFYRAVLISGETNHTPMKTPCRSMNEAFALYRLNGMHKQIEVTKESENVNQTVAEAVRKSFGNQVNIFYLNLPGLISVTWST